MVILDPPPLPPVVTGLDKLHALLCIGQHVRLSNAGARGSDRAFVLLGATFYGPEFGHMTLAVAGPTPDDVGARAWAMLEERGFVTACNAQGAEVAYSYDERAGLWRAVGRMSRGGRRRGPRMLVIEDGAERAKR
jgi:hypothetical protein